MVLRPFLDGMIPTSQQPGNLLTQGRADTEILFLEMVDEVSGRCQYPADSIDPDETVVAPLAEGIYQAGAICPAILGPDGRITMVYPPLGIDISLDDPGVIVVGDGTQWRIDQTQEAQTVASRAELAAQNLEKVTGEQAARLEQVKDAFDEFVPEVLGEVTEALRLVAAGEAVAVEIRAQALEALEKAFEVEGGLSTVMEQVAALETTLPPQITAAMQAIEAALTEGREAREKALEALGKAIEVEGGLTEAMDTLETDLRQGIDDAAASVVTDARLSEASLSVWPFVNGAVPEGALAPGSVGASEIQDFAITVVKMNSPRHQLF